jgi:hypothetical protein
MPAHDNIRLRLSSCAIKPKGDDPTCRYYHFLTREVANPVISASLLIDWRITILGAICAYAYHVLHHYTTRDAAWLASKGS